MSERTADAKWIAIWAVGMAIALAVMSVASAFTQTACIERGGQWAPKGHCELPSSPTPSHSIEGER